jgi:hypothetical protein
MSPADAHVQLVRDATFARLDVGGGISGTRGTAPDGLFLRDARHLSRWQLTVDGAEPAALVPATADTDDTATCVLTPQGTRDNPPAYTVFREQTVTAGTLTERLRLVSNRPDPVTARVDLTVDADFADLFELRADDRHYAKPGAHPDRRQGRTRQRPGPELGAGTGRTRRGRTPPHRSRPPARHAGRGPHLTSTGAPGHPGHRRPDASL